MPAPLHRAGADLVRSAEVRPGALDVEQDTIPKSDGLGERDRNDGNEHDSNNLECQSRIFDICLTAFDFTQMNGWGWCLDLNTPPDAPRNPAGAPALHASLPDLCEPGRAAAGSAAARIAAVVAVDPVMWNMRKDIFLIARKQPQRGWRSRARRSPARSSKRSGDP
jgi:hypothetical protein